MIPEEKYLICFFGKSSNYYLEKYRQYHNGEKLSFNISAFLTGLLWFLYRKLWIESSIILLILIAIGIIEQHIYDYFSISFDIQTVIVYLSFFCNATVYGFIGNYLYIKSADRKIKKILSGTNDEEKRLKQLHAQGGVTWLPIILLLIIFIVLVIVFNLMTF